jgi:hypothetical protein
VVFRGDDGKYPTDAQQMLTSMRLFRRDELLAIGAGCTLNARAPSSVQREPAAIAYGAHGAHTADTPLAVAADNLGIRVLVDRVVVGGALTHPLQPSIHLARYTVYGKPMSNHCLPMSAQSFYGCGRVPPNLYNYGDVSGVHTCARAHANLQTGKHDNHN